MPIRFTCIGCGAVINAPDKAAGRKGKCPSCGGEITVPSAPDTSSCPPNPPASKTELPATVSPSPAQPSHAQSAATIPFTCQNCLHTGRVPEHWAGKTGRCPKCKAKVAVANIASPPSPALPPPVPVPQESQPNPWASLDAPEPMSQECQDVNPFARIDQSAPVDVLPAEHGDYQVTGCVINPDEAKAAIRQLKAKKKELLIAKRAIMQQQREVRADYTDDVRQRGSKFRGRGLGFGRIIRDFQTMSRDARRKSLANELAPLDEGRSKIETQILATDSAILRLQSYTE